MRSKEEANDYRYFPDPDLLPLMIDPSLIESIRSSLPELPWEKQQRFISQYSLNDYDATILSSQRELSEYFEIVVNATPPGSAKLVANWIIGDLLGALNK